MATIAERHVTLMLKRAPDARRVRFGSVVTFGVIDTSDSLIDDGNGASKRDRMTVLTLPTDGLPTLADGNTVVVYATKDVGSTQTSYMVRDKQLTDDGLTVRYLVVAS